MTPRREWVQGCAMKPTQPNGARQVSIVQDTAITSWSWIYVIDLDWRLWVQSVTTDGKGPWEMALEPTRRRRSPKK